MGTVSGTVANPGASDVSVTITGPRSDGWSSVTVPMEMPPQAMTSGDSETATTRGGTTDTCVVRIVPAYSAFTCTGFGANGPAIAGAENMTFVVCNPIGTDTLGETATNDALALLQWMLTSADVVCVRTIGASCE